MSFQRSLVVLAALVLVAAGFLLWESQPWRSWPAKPVPHHVVHFIGSYPVLEGPRAEQVATTFILLDEEGRQRGSFTVPVGAPLPDPTLPSYSLRFVPEVRTRTGWFNGVVYYNVGRRDDGHRDAGKSGGGIIAS